MTARGRRRGYTLMEVLIVLAILVMLAAIAVPSLRGMYPYWKQQGALDAVRAALAEARGRAINEGRPYRFSISASTGHFRIAPDKADYWTGSQQTDDPDGQGFVMEKAVPPGVTMTLNGEPIPIISLQEAPMSSEAKKEDVQIDTYATAVVFLPTGGARENVRVVFQIKGTRGVVLKVRALTGTMSTETLSE